jgi:hypothetical protein
MNVSQECKSKATPEQAPSAQGSCETSRFPDSQHVKLVKLSVVAPAAFNPQEIFLVSFLLQAEPTQGHRSAGMRQ